MDTVLGGWFLDLLTGAGQSAGGAFSFVCGMSKECEYLILGLRVVVLLFLVGWVRSRMGGGLIATVVLLFVGYLVLFQFWWLFGPLAIVYLAAMYGALGMFITFLFTKEAYFPGLKMPGGPQFNPADTGPHNWRPRPPPPPG